MNESVLTSSLKDQTSRVLEPTSRPEKPTSRVLRGRFEGTSRPLRGDASNDASPSSLAAKEKNQANFEGNGGKEIYGKIFETPLEGFIEHLKILKQSPKTISAYTQHVRQFLKWLWAEKEIYDLKEASDEKIRAYQSFISSKNYSLETVHMKLRSLKRFFEYLEKTHQLLYNPAEKLVFPALGDRLPKNILTEREIKDLLNSPNTSRPIGIRDKTILELLYSSGIRREECARLTVHDVDYQGGYLRINLGKGGKDRVVPIGKKACEYLREYLLKVRPKYASPDERALFISNFKKALGDQSIALIVKKYGRRAEIKKAVTTHSLRRSFATHMLKNDAHPVYIQRILGHSTSSVLNRYIKVAGLDIKKTHQKTHPREKDRR